jgi:hypothetical protein
MSFAFISDLMIVSMINFVVVFGGTIGILVLKDKFFPQSEEGESDE